MTSMPLCIAVIWFWNWLNMLPTSMPVSICPMPCMGCHELEDACGLMATVVPGPPVNWMFASAGGGTLMPMPASEPPHAGGKGAACGTALGAAGGLTGCPGGGHPVGGWGTLDAAICCFTNHLWPFSPMGTFHLFQAYLSCHSTCAYALI
jgi:hypothetical protein